MNLRILLVIHAIITFAAGVVLIVVPAAIPDTVDIAINPEQYLLSYFLGAAELAIAYLSFYSRKINDGYALRKIIITFIIFHLATGILEIYGLSQNVSPGIWGNIILRLVMVILFWYYGISQLKNRTNNKEKK